MSTRCTITAQTAAKTIDVARPNSGRAMKYTYDKIAVGMTKTEIQIRTTARPEWLNQAHRLSWIVLCAHGRKILVSERSLVRCGSRRTLCPRVRWHTVTSLRRGVTMS